MNNTKERILTEALRLFARDGYEAVSVSTIAGALGMTKGALYRHYKNKHDIFDSIVEKMYRIDAERSRLYGVPEETYAEAPGAYRETSMEAVRAFSLNQYLFWTEDPFATDFRRMLTLEQYRNREMAELYHSCLTAGPVLYLEDIFREMTERGLLIKADPKQLALEFYAPLYLLIAWSDGAGDREESLRRLSAHIDGFIGKYTNMDQRRNENEISAK